MLTKKKTSSSFVKIREIFCWLVCLSVPVALCVGFMKKVAWQTLLPALLLLMFVAIYRVYRLFVKENGVFPLKPWFGLYFLAVLLTGVGTILFVFGVLMSQDAFYYNPSLSTSFMLLCGALSAAILFALLALLTCPWRFFSRNGTKRPGRRTASRHSNADTRHTHKRGFTGEPDEVDFETEEVTPFMQGKEPRA